MNDENAPDEFGRDFKFYNCNEMKTIPGIRALLGKGGFGMIIRALHEDDGELAVKIFEPTGSISSIIQAYKRYEHISFYSYFMLKFSNETPFLMVKQQITHRKIHLIMRKVSV